MISLKAFHPSATAWRRCGAGPVLGLPLSLGVRRTSRRTCTGRFRPPSPSHTDTPLAALVQQRRQAASARNESGFLLLDGPPAAYGSRLALAEGAQKTLDLQYYAIHADASTGRLLAAGTRCGPSRGARAHSAGRLPQHRPQCTGDAPGLRAQHRDADVQSATRPARFEPGPHMFNAVEDASRIQQRMHNKLFIADNVSG